MTDEVGYKKPKKKKKTKAELREIISKQVSDNEIIKIATDIAHGGEDIDIAIKAATEEVQSLTRVKPALEEQKRNRGRKRVVVKFLKGVAEGRETVYWEDIAQKLEARGEVKILREYK